MHDDVIFIIVLQYIVVHHHKSHHNHDHQQQLALEHKVPYVERERTEGHLYRQQHQTQRSFPHRAGYPQHRADEGAVRALRVVAVALEQAVVGSLAGEGGGAHQTRRSIEVGQSMSRAGHAFKQLWR